MTKLLFVTMICLLGFAGCKAAEEAQLKSSQLYVDEGCGICGKSFSYCEWSMVFTHPKGGFCHFDCHWTVKSAFGIAFSRIEKAIHAVTFAFRLDLFEACRCELVKRVQEDVAPRTILEYASENIDRLKEVFDRNTQPAINCIVGKMPSMRQGRISDY